ncbi:plastocyanin/azurin family copper-binding protein [Nocardioides sp.]|uniref:plastocyanin/azurin family copper-binding protein n=1 Tax=Nocardioides sp. TaxID=35761 RepID=UPI003517EC93
MTVRSHRPPSGLLLRLVAGTLVSLTALLGWSLSPASASGEGHHHVDIKNYAYAMPDLRIDQGDTVTWTNLDDAPHDVTVTAGPATFTSPMLEKGDSWSHTFDTAGDYSYLCSIHPDMRAAVSVAAAPVAAPAPVPETAPAPAPVDQAAPDAVAPAPAAVSPREARAAAREARAAQRAAEEAAATSAAATTPAPVVAAPTGLDPSLSPLLLVAGMAIAVVVFCLLLLSAAPPAPQLPGPGPEDAAPVPDDSDTRVDLPVAG